MRYTIYNPQTGQITGLLSVTADVHAEANLANKSYVEGIYDSKQYYIDIDTKTAVALPAKPEAPEYAKLTFDWTAKTWTVDTSKVTDIMRNRRNDFLRNHVDKVNAVWYTNLSPNQQQEFRTYRTALLDVPQQSGFPTNITWPTKPAWL